MIKNFGFGLLVITGLALSLAGCSEANSVSELQKDAVYIGKGATDEIIEVQSKETWKVKDMYKDDSNYTIATVKELDEKVDEYPLIELTSKEIYGEVSSFSRREGRKYILVEDELGDLYFRSISEENIDQVTEELGKRKTLEEKNDYLIEIAKFEFSKQ